MVDLLCQVWAVGGSDSEAAYFADIDKGTLSRYLEYRPSVAQRKARLLERPILLARRAIIESFDGHKATIVEGRKKRSVLTVKNPEMALRYLERKLKNEFSLRSEVSGPGGTPLTTNADAQVEGMRNDVSKLNRAIADEMAEIKKLQSAVKAKPRKR